MLSSYAISHVRKSSPFIRARSGGEVVEEGDSPARPDRRRRCCRSRDLLRAGGNGPTGGVVAMGGGIRGAEQDQQGGPWRLRHCGHGQFGRCLPGCFSLNLSTSRSSRRRWRSRYCLDLAVVLLALLDDESEPESEGSFSFSRPLPLSSSEIRTSDNGLVGT